METVIYNTYDADFQNFGNISFAAIVADHPVAPTVVSCKTLQTSFDYFPLFGDVYGPLFKLVATCCYIRDLCLFSKSMFH